MRCQDFQIFDWISSINHERWQLHRQRWKESKLMRAVTSSCCFWTSIISTGKESFQLPESTICNWKWEKLNNVDSHSWQLLRCTIHFGCPAALSSFKLPEQRRQWEDEDFRRFCIPQLGQLSFLSWVAGRDCRYATAAAALNVSCRDWVAEASLSFLVSAVPFALMPAHPFWLPLAQKLQHRAKKHRLCVLMLFQSGWSDRSISGGRHLNGRRKSRF